MDVEEKARRLRLQAEHLEQIIGRRTWRVRRLYETAEKAERRVGERGFSGTQGGEVSSERPRELAAHHGRMTIHRHSGDLTLLRMRAESHWTREFVTMDDYRALEMELAEWKDIGIGYDTPELVRKDLLAKTDVIIKAEDARDALKARLADEIAATKALSELNERILDRETALKAEVERLRKWQREVRAGFGVTDADVEKARGKE